MISYIHNYIRKREYADEASNDNNCGVTEEYDPKGKTPIVDVPEVKHHSSLTLLLLASLVLPWTIVVHMAIVTTSKAGMWSWKLNFDCSFLVCGICKPLKV